MNNRTAIFCLIAFSFCILVMYSFFINRPINVEISNEKVKATFLEITSSSNTPSNSINTIKQLTTKTNVSSQTNSHPLWLPIDTNTIEPDSRYSRYNRVAIARIDPTTFKLLHAGSEIEIEIPQDTKKYVISFETEEQVDADNRSISGHLKDYGEDFPVTFTIGATAIYGSILTPREAFNIRGQGDIVRIIPVSELEKHIDYKKTDAVDWKEQHK